MPGHAVASFFQHVAGGARGSDELAQIAPALGVVRQHHQAKINPWCRCVHIELGPREQLQAHGFGGHMGAHHATHRTLVGDGNRAVTQLGRALDQLMRV